MDRLSGAWDPGVESQVPAHLRHLCTFLRPENVVTSLTEARELSDLTGLSECELITFRPERLALHEILIRVTADFSVPDGAKIEDLGINFREITRVVLAKYLAPRMDRVTAAYEAARQQLSRWIAAELAVEPSPRVEKQSVFARFSRPRKTSPAPSSQWPMHRLATWQTRTRSVDDDSLEAAACRALTLVAVALLNRHGQVWGTRELIASLATQIACNDAGSDAIGREIGPLLLEAARAEGYELLPRQEHPVVMNTKGPSASGKSTLRPLQRALAGELGIPWREFALISPDIWRKQLLDYSTLGAAYKYAGAFTADELRIVDQKLDRHMARKARRGVVSHLLIDRFRFDSFAAESYEAGSNLLTRFGHIVYLFFMITPPASLVERAWIRGLEVGRYKAVDDTLAHGVEAYSGMPDLLFTWIQRTDKRVHFEFLDNSVPFGQRPRTVAFGCNDQLNVLDVKALIDVERYRKVNINARAPSSLYTGRESLEARDNLGFFRKCIERFPEIHFALQSNGSVYLTLVSGKPTYVDAEPMARAIQNADTSTALSAIVASLFNQAIPTAEQARYLSDYQIETVGQWGT